MVFLGVRGGEHTLGGRASAPSRGEARYGRASTFVAVVSLNVGITSVSQPSDGGI